MDDPTEHAASGPVLYLTGLYPAPSHTFILREVAALRRRGLDIRTATVRRPTEKDLLGPEERAEHADTFAVLPAARNPFRLLSDHLAAFLRAPGRYAGALALALRTARPGLKGFVWQLFYFAEAAIVARHMGRIGAAQLHSHFAASNASLAMIAAHMAGRPFSFTLHGPADLLEPLAFRLDAKIARARWVACISHYARSQAMFLSDRAHWDKLAIVRCGVEPGRYTPAPPPAHDRLELLFVGRVTAIKGLFVLLDALSALPDLPLRLSVIGDGPDRAALERAARDRGLDIAFLGFRSQAEVADAMAEADAVVLPSFGEGLPVVLMEAFATARPVIATRVAAVEELVEAGASGFVVPPGDPQALADAIRRLAEMPPEARAAMGARGRARVEAEFDIDLQAERLDILFAPAGRDT